jgi:hypothetical protein
MFLIEFENGWERSKVMEGRPWVFDGNLVSLAYFDGLTFPICTEFWQGTFLGTYVQSTFSVHGKGNWLSDWGSSVGMVEEVDVDEEGVGWGEFLRVQILLDVTKPLSRGRMITLKQKVLWVAFQYEKMLLLWGN